MMIKEDRTLTMVRDKNGYRFAKRWCKFRKDHGIEYQMLETETSIILEEHRSYEEILEENDEEM